jgi:hypothetical protein
LHEIAIHVTASGIANARQNLQNKVFFSFPGEVFLIKKKKKVFMKNLPSEPAILA